MFSAGGLEDHKRKIHLEITETVKCDICCEMITKNCLKQHMISHHGEKLTCNVCDKNFATEEVFKKHKFLHHGHEVSKYSCDICNKEYSNSSNLNRHRKTVHNIIEL